MACYAKYMTQHLPGTLLGSSPVDIEVKIPYQFLQCLCAVTLFPMVTVVTCAVVLVALVVDRPQKGSDFDYGWFCRVVQQWRRVTSTGSSERSCPTPVTQKVARMAFVRIGHVSVGTLCQSQILGPACAKASTARASSLSEMCAWLRGDWFPHGWESTHWGWLR